MACLSFPKIQYQFPLGCSQWIDKLLGLDWRIGDWWDAHWQWVLQRFALQPCKRGIHKPNSSFVEVEQAFPCMNFRKVLLCLPKLSQRKLNSFPTTNHQTVFLNGADVSFRESYYRLPGYRESSILNWTYQYFLALFLHDSENTLIEFSWLMLFQHVLDWFEE